MKRQLKDEVDAATRELISACMTFHDVYNLRNQDRVLDCTARLKAARIALEKWSQKHPPSPTVPLVNTPQIPNPTKNP